jgi:wobble nucleotide-excising tRNase
MIEKLDIANFGSFNGFRWDTDVREPHGAVGRFKKLNILYGRNYSGKTTLSRIFRSFEVGQTPSRYENPSFQIKTVNGLWTQAQLSAQGTPIRVYNKDFIEAKLAAAKDAYLRALDELSTVARERSENIFSTRELSEVVPDSDCGVSAALKEANELIRMSNEHTAHIAAAQKQLQDELRLSEVAAFVAAIGLDDIQAEIKQDQQKLEALTNEREALEAEGKRLRAALEALQAQHRDEKRGAELVNRYLGHSLGGTNLRLQAEEEEGKATYRFRIMRGEKEAFNLSEGECSLVAFCYYLARLDDAQTHGTKPIIYIDDPISSLDSNHSLEQLFGSASLLNLKVKFTRHQVP